MVLLGYPESEQTVRKVKKAIIWLDDRLSHQSPAAAGNWKT
jgi:hypothetical protein